MTSYLLFPALYLAGVLPILVIRSWRTLAWSIAGSLTLLICLFILASRGGALIAVAFGLMFVAVAIGLVVGGLTRALLLAVGGNNHLLRGGVAVVGVAAYPAWVLLKIYLGSLTSEQLADREYFRTHPVQFPQCEVFKKSIYVHEAIIEPGTETPSLYLRWPDELKYHVLSAGIPIPQAPQRQKSLDIALPYPAASKGHIWMIIRATSSLHYKLKSLVAASSPKTVDDNSLETSPKVESSLRHLSSDWHEDVYAAAKDGKWTNIITCDKSERVPAPHCQQYFQYRNAHIRLSYPRPMLTDWQRIRVAANEYMGCAYASEGFANP